MWISPSFCGILFSKIFFISKCLNYNEFIEMVDSARRYKLGSMVSTFKNIGRSALFIPLVVISIGVMAQKASVIKFDALQEILDTKNEQIQVINFWATWCAPCIKELPLLEKLNARNDLNAKITLINLDYADKVEKVNEFITRKNIRSRVLLLDELDYNAWIDKVDKGWTGAIPATLVFDPKTGKRRFVEKELKEGELEELIGSLK
jgi:thiol-disulfide isomerase/thioredoxin